MPTVFTRSRSRFRPRRRLFIPSRAVLALGPGFGFDFKDATGTLHSCFVPETTALGDLIVRGTSRNQRLAGNTTTVRQVLTQTGTGSASALPVWTTPPPVVREKIWRYSSNTTMADPGSGYVRADGVPGPVVTQIAFSKLDSVGTDISNLLAALLAGDDIFIQDQDDAADWLRYTVAGVATNNTSWFQVPVTFLDGVTGGAANNTHLLFAFSTAGGGGGAPPSTTTVLSSDVALGTSYANVGLSCALAAAGTWEVIVEGSVALNITAVVPGTDLAYIQGKLRDTTNSADITSTVDRRLLLLSLTQLQQVSFAFSGRIALVAAATVHLQMRYQTAGGSITVNSALCLADSNIHCQKVGP